jgi:pimeloyl-ACP methyl ester carboxylesterase
MSAKARLLTFELEVHNFHQVANDMLQAMSVIGIPKAHIFASSLGSQIAVVMQSLAPGAQRLFSSGFSELDVFLSLI